MYIGALAKLTGCTPKAIRLYEAMGLLPEPARQGKYRVYTPHHAEVIRLIRTAQAVGFKLSEMEEMIREKLRRDTFPVEMALERIAAKREDVRRQIDELHALDGQLAALAAQVVAEFGDPQHVPEVCTIHIERLMPAAAADAGRPPAGPAPADAG